jgi:hypothetical protein
MSNRLVSLGVLQLGTTLALGSYALGAEKRGPTPVWQETTVLTGHNGTVLSVAWSPTGEFIASRRG